MENGYRKLGYVLFKAHSIDHLFGLYFSPYSPVAFSIPTTSANVIFTNTSVVRQFTWLYHIRNQNVIGC